MKKFCFFVSVFFLSFAASAETEGAESFDVMGQLYDQAALPSEDTYLGQDAFFAGRCANSQGMVENAAFVLALRSLPAAESRSGEEAALIFVLKSHGSKNSYFDEGFAPGERELYERAVTRESFYIEEVERQSEDLVTTMPFINESAIYLRTLGKAESPLWIARFNRAGKQTGDTYRCVFDRRI